MVDVGTRTRSRERAGWTPDGVPGFAVALAVLVIGLVPAVVLATGVHALPALAGALVAYGLLAVVTGRVVPAVVAAVPVLATVNATLPLRPGPSRTVDLQLVVGDAAVLAALALVVLVASGSHRGRARSWIRSSGTSRLSGTNRRSWALTDVRDLLGVPGALLAGFAAWGILAAAFAAHDPTTAAVFGVLQFRYVAYFAVAAGLVATGLATLRQLSVALVVAVLAHSGFALAQLANGGPLGLAYLGETAYQSHLTVRALGVEREAGRYLGALVGNNAAYATLAVPVVAALVWVGTRARGWLRWLVVPAIGLIGALCVPLSQYDVATLSFTAVVVGSLALATLPIWPEWARAPILRDRRRALGIGLAAGAAAAVAVLAVGAIAVFDALPVVESKNLGNRLHDYTNAITVALENPLFGVGGGNVEPVGSELGFSSDLAIHSILFSYLAETGFVGAALWVGAVASTGVLAVRLAWTRGDCDLVGFLCIGALGFLTIAMIDQIWDNHTSLGVFWLFAGAIVGAYRTEVTGRSRTAAGRDSHGGSGRRSRR